LHSWPFPKRAPFTAKIRNDLLFTNRFSSQKCGQRCSFAHLREVGTSEKPSSRRFKLTDNNTPTPYSFHNRSNNSHLKFGPTATRSMFNGGPHMSVQYFGHAPFLASDKCADSYPKHAFLRSSSRLSAGCYALATLTNSRISNPKCLVPARHGGHGAANSIPYM